jgi:phospholipid/cholesterol/gamma-HCH transport system substrate-binding protein
MPKLLDRASVSALVKLIIFIVVTTMATSVLVVTIGNLSFGDKVEYKAVFSDVTGVNKGDDIRIAGVRVGTVQSVELDESDEAVVTFDVDATVELTESTGAMIRYRNLIGQRYIALEPGAAGDEMLAADATIPLERTRPALDLTVLFRGFEPLFEALSPDDVNQLSFEIIQVLQGEGGTIENLLARTASLTTTLANRDELIGDVITNLNDVLVTLGNKDDELSQTILTLQQFATGLKTDRKAILGSLDAISELSVDTADLLQDARPVLTSDIRELRRLTEIIDRNKAAVDDSLQILPIKLDKMGNTAQYGSFFNYYLCSFTGKLIVPEVLAELLGKKGEYSIPIDYTNGASRCSQ